MDNKKWFATVMIPNLAMALGGIFFAVLCLGALGWLMHWEPLIQNAKYIVGGIFGILTCVIPIIILKSGRCLMLRFLRQRSIIQLVVAEIIIWCFTLLEIKRDESHAMTYMYDSSVWDYIIGFVTPLCALLATLSCIAGIIVGGFTFISIIFQRSPKPLWDDTTPRKRN